MARYLIVGGVAGGATTAARIRRLDEKAEILLFERGEHISFANCGLPYYIGGVIKERDRLFVTTVDSFHKRYRIDIRPFNEVISIDRGAKKVRVREVKTGREYDESYDKLLLSPGAEPLRPPIPGIDSEGIFTLRNVPDTDTIKSWIDTKNPTHAVVIGGGFIGVEMAENLAHKGIAVTLVEALDQVMTVLDFEMAAEVHNHIRSKNVQLILKDGVKSFVKKGEKLVVELSSGRTIETEMVILSIGVRPESSLAKKAELELTDRGAIVVDAHLRTSDKNIYAVGDAIAFDYPLVKKKLSIYLAGPANKQGRIAADNIVLGDTRIYKGTIGTSVAKVFDMTVASTGLSEKVLKAEGVTCLSSVTHSSSHAGYYPEAKPMSIKLVFSPEGKVYGAQITGYDGVDTRIDMIAAVLGMGGTVFDLEELEHAYAPPFSSAKDPVNTAGFAAENVVRGLVKNVSWNEIAAEKDSFQLDVRTRNEFSLGAIPGSVNIPIDELRENLHQIPKGRRIVTNCAAGLRGYLAARILKQNGYNDVVNLSGGYKTWERATAPQDSSASEEYIGSDDMVYKKGVAPEALQSPDAIILDACGLACPGPIVKLKAAIDTMLEGRELVVTASDPGFARDVRSWCAMTGNTLLMVKEEVGKVIAVIRKGTLHKEGVKMVETSAGQTIIVFSDDLDKALAAFVLATGGAAAGKKVTMFFTFWGLSVIKKPKARGVKKDLMGRMFGMMLPSNAGKLGLSKINMGGIGALMMRLRMKSKKIDSLEAMINTARSGGVEMMACQMSMDVMGVAREELCDFVSVGGVAAYLEAASKSGINLFI
jgi:NADPH-dependent 2,4-dienoyl-CoA reductase/sulfur reductase-like enzyme/peroxiredoxin family protein/rhodanese-related sulfurtransferase/TusA-related sulfurtransferase